MLFLKTIVAKTFFLATIDKGFFLLMLIIVVFIDINLCCYFF